MSEMITTASAELEAPEINNLTKPPMSDLEPGQLRIIRRNGSAVPYDDSKIKVAMTKAFLAVEGNTAVASRRIHEKVDELALEITKTLQSRALTNGTIHIEFIQDQVELALMRAGEQKVARAYVLYREERHKERQEKVATPTQIVAPKKASGINVMLADGASRPLDFERLQTIVQEACAELSDVDPDIILKEVQRNLYNGMPESDVGKALIITARAFVERDPNYSDVTARLLLDELRAEALTYLGVATNATFAEMFDLYGTYFRAYLKKGVALERISDKLLTFDLDKITAALKPERDHQFTYLSMQTLYDRYFIHHNGTRFELPQAFFMRVAMGLAIEEDDRETRAIEFYNLLSSFDFMSSTPTLFNAGTMRPQLSSCFLTTVGDDLDGIYGAIKDNALLSKYAGGLGNDWTPVRAMGAHIHGTNGKSQGVVPFLNVADATAIAVNQCFAPDTLLYTANGIKAIKDIKIGDLVLGQRGEYREVLDHMLYNQTDPMVELNVKHSIRPIKVTAGHPIWAIQDVAYEQSTERTLDQLTRGKLMTAWVDAGKLKANDYIGQTIPQEIIPVENFNEEDARLYGILLGDGHLSEHEWGVSGNPQKDEHLNFVCEYLEKRGIHYWMTDRGENYQQIRWSIGKGLVRDGSTGQFVSGGNSALPFSSDDIYNTKKEKHIARRFSHLPRQQTLALIKGLLETDGGINRGKEIYFTNTSESLAEGLRYQLLRLGIPSAGQYREREQSHTGTRDNGETIAFNTTTKAYDICVPAVTEIAELVGCQPITKRNWLVWGKTLFTRLRSIKSITPVPFVYDLKVEGDESYMTTAALAHNGGKRKGAVCAYLEVWHKDFEDFLELRKNTGDDRRRTHDMNTAAWVNDLFMQRVHEKKDWTLFSPDEVPELHDLYGKAFEKAYVAYEEKARRGEIKNYKVVSAIALWRKMLSMLFETGHPWITFKDPCNLRSPQQHTGVVHSSNLCTEITLNTSKEEVAVCNLGSVNLPQHMDENNRFDVERLKKTVKTAIRMLDNVININYYTIPQARQSNLKHRPIGIGVMGFQDCLYRKRIPYASEAAVKFADRYQEYVSYYALEASAELAQERGSYESFDGSLWSQGVLPIDSVKAVIDARDGKNCDMDQSSTLDWDALRKKVKKGMRNSNVMAIAPTATISNICGVSQSIEPTYQNLYVKSNMSGEFTVVNPYLVRDLKARGLWDDVMVNDLKYYDGSVQRIDRIPEELKALYATAFEVDPSWLVAAGAKRQKWIDQSQSLNLYMANPSGKKLDTLYRHAWTSGLKTTYYLRSLGASHMEKSTVTTGTLNAVQATDVGSTAPKACSIDDPDCEACQ